MASSVTSEEQERLSRSLCVLVLSLAALDAPGEAGRQIDGATDSLRALRGKSLLATIAAPLPSWSFVTFAVIALDERQRRAQSPNEIPTLRAVRMTSPVVGTVRVRPTTISFAFPLRSTW